LKADFLELPLQLHGQMKRTMDHLLFHPPKQVFGGAIPKLNFACRINRNNRWRRGVEQRSKEFCGMVRQHSES
jgi:hypothetical protein